MNGYEEGEYKGKNENGKLEWVMNGRWKQWKRWNGTKMSRIGRLFRRFFASPFPYHIGGAHDTGAMQDASQN